MYVFNSFIITIKIVIISYYFINYFYSNIFFQLYHLFILENDKIISSVSSIFIVFKVLAQQFSYYLKKHQINIQYMSYTVVHIVYNIP